MRTMGSKNIVLFLTLLVINAPKNDGAKILAVFSTPSYSHQIVFRPIWEELAKKGHEMIVLTPNILENNTYPNLRQVDLKYTYEILRKGLDLSDIRPKTWRQQFSEQQEILRNIDEAELSTDEVQEIIKNEKNIDLVIVQWFSPVMIAFGGKFKCPIIAVSSLNGYNFMYDTFGNPNHPVLHPEYMTGLAGQLTFWERLETTAFSLWQQWYYHYDVLPKADKVIKKYMGQDMPALEEIKKNISMMFLNVNPLMIKPRPNLPTIVEFTAMHIKKQEPLPMDIKDFLDNSKNGVIYLSLGTNVRSSGLPLKLREIILQALSELPYNVLWKYEDDSLKNKPKNIMIKKWIPQQDVLAHKNVKLFMMQGGAQSLEEALHYQVPIVGLPVFSDQPRNIMLATKLGVALGVNPKTVTKEELKKTLLEVIENKQYKNNIIKISEILKDQPMTSKDKVIWWIEYVLRHKGAPHLRSSYAEIEWWKYFCLDSIIFVILSCVFSVYFSIKITKYTSKKFQEIITIKIKTQ